VAQPPEESKTETLPDPELNPLLNPLLASHMGEWAEVYFTSPPEKRAAAVAKLLRELANKQHVDVSQVLTSENLNPEPVYHEAHSPAEERPTNSFPAKESVVVTCGYCGHGNSDPQRFCGMCGMPLTSQPETPAEQTAEQTEKFEDRGHEDYEPRVRESSYEFDSADVSEAVEESASSPENSPWSRPYGIPASLTVLSEYEEPASHPYRLYVGLAVAVILGLLIYVMWRSNGTWHSNSASSATPEAVPNAPPESAPPAAEPAQPKPEGNATSNTAAAPVTSPPTPAKPAATSRNRSGRSAEAILAKPNAVPQAAASRAVAAPALQTGGSEELATAEKYLNAASGRNSGQAAFWLWKAVAKQNLTATVMLSDLYLRGDGVTKSCDQARLLLDAAVRKGGTGAAERLRNLQAFGCQ
jgi:hypothetical protein